MSPASRKRGRLSRSGDFDRVYKRGRSHGNRFYVLYSFPRERAEEGAEGPRLGLSVSKRVGDAVRRNAVKRSIREAFWADESILPAGYDFVVVARPDSAAQVERDGTPAVRESLRELIEKVG
ncbi:ribonuclease P protein component [Thermoleophilia bacterium SCSIO 60948]|nr:ribonuclease P protein component [Thermoleophilia bacterium SCSIO 60948]